METFWHTARDGAKFRILQWSPQGSLRGHVLLLHGHGEHAIRHADCMNLLAASGWRVTGWDLRGHGRSSGRRGWIDSYEQLLEDTHEIVRQCRSEHDRDRPLILYGHSMGGQLALRLAIEEPDKFSGVITTAPWLRLRIRPPAWKRALAAWAAIHAPWLTMSTGIRHSQLTSSPQICLPAVEAALLHRRMSARMFDELEKGARYLLEHADQLTTPCLIVQGEDDPIMAPNAASQFAEATGDHCALVLLPGVRHEPHNDPCRNDVVCLVTDWLKERESPKLKTCSQ